MSGAGAALGAILVLLGGCAGSGAGTGQSAAPTGPRGADALVPPGYGTLTQAQFTLHLGTGDLQIQVTPLAESVIRLAAPDTYQRLTSISASARSSLRSRAREESPLFLV